MPADIYLRIPNDPNYNPSEIDVDDKLFNFLQGVEMILTTNKGEIFGVPELGASLESYLWNPYITSSVIKTEINKQIATYCGDNASSIPYNIDVNFVKGQITDSIIVDLLIDGTKVLGIAATPTNKNQGNSTK